MTSAQELDSMGSGHNRLENEQLGDDHDQCSGQVSLVSSWSQLDSMSSGHNRLEQDQGKIYKVSPLQLVIILPTSVNMIPRRPLVVLLLIVIKKMSVLKIMRRV